MNQIAGFEVASPVMSTNYPGSLYSIFYGDEDQNIAANTEYYTHSRLQECNTLEHVYDLATCSSEFKDNNVDELGYYFKLDFKLLSKGIFDGETPGEFICDDYTQNAYYFFGDFPDNWTLLGLFIVVLSGIYISRREVVVKRI